MSERSLVEMVSAIVYQTRERYERGEQYLQRDLANLQHQLKVAQKLDAPIVEADIHQLIGVFLVTAATDLPAALEHFNMARSLYERTNQQSRLAQSLMRIGAWYGFVGDYGKAIEYTEQAGAIADAEHQMSLIAHCKCNLGSAYSHQGNYTDALQMYEQASELLKSSSISRRRGTLILQIEYGFAINKLSLKQYDAAWEYADRLYRLASAYSDATFRVRSARTIALLLIRAPRQYDHPAMHYVQEAYRLIDETQRLIEKPAVLEIEAELLERNEQLDAARGKYEEAIELYEITHQFGLAEQLRRRLGNDVPAPELRPSREMQALIVEDDADMRQYLSDLLGQYEWSFEIHSTGNGERALQMAEENPPDVILLDIHIDGNLDGYEVARHIRAEAKTQHAKIIILTGLGDPKNIVTGQRAGADAYLVKPIDYRSLESTIADLLEPAEEA